MSPFGNKIKTLREAQNLTQVDLGEEVGLSTQFISFLERGQRKPSPESIEKFARYFKIEESQLLELRDEEMAYPTATSISQNQGLPEHIQSVVDALMMVEEDESKKMADDFLIDLNKRLLSLLKSYNFRDVKNEVLNIRSKWTAINLSNTPGNKHTEIINGCIQLDKSIYFSIEYNDTMMKLVLQANNFSQIKPFEEWMDHHHVSYVTDELIPHISTAQRVVHFYWFSPITSSFDKFNILNEMQVDLKSLDVYDNQLNWLIQSQLRNAMYPESDDQVS